MLRYLWGQWGRLLRAIPGTSILGTLWGKLGHRLNKKTSTKSGTETIGSAIMWTLLGYVTAFIVLMLILLLCSGCSAVKKIADETNKVRQNATDIRTEVVTAKDALHRGDDPAVEASLDVIDGKAVNIQASADTVQKEITQVVDKVPYWMRLLKATIVFLSICGVIFLMWRFNLFLIAEKAIQGFVNLVAKWIGA